MKKLLISLGLLGLSCSSLAGTYNGKITDIIVRASDNLHYVTIEGTRENAPECAADSVYMMIKDENSVTGKSQMSVLLTAFATRKTVMLTGTGSCTRWHNGEDINTVRVTHD